MSCPPPTPIANCQKEPLLTCPSLARSVSKPSSTCRIQTSSTTLRQRFRKFSFPLSVAFIVWYLGYVLLSTYAVDFMKTTVVGNVNLGIVLGLLQFVTTFTITWLYIRHANKNLDPIATKLREKLEASR